MLDGTAICLSMLFLFSLIRFVRKPGVGWWLVLTASVCLAAVVKAITVAIFLVTAAVWLMQRLWWARLAWRRHPAARQKLRRRLLSWTVSGGLTVACLLTAVSSWKDFADGVNLASPYTAFHSSTRLGEWIFGTLQQRLNPVNWLLLAGRWLCLAFPVVLAALPVIPLLRWSEFPKSVVCLGAGAWSGLLITVLIFFNLFVRHDYYLWSAVPLLSIVAAFGARWMWEQNRLSRRLTCPQAAVWLGSVLLGLVPYGYWSFRFDYEDPICKLGRLIAEVTPEDEYVVIADFDWHTSVLYYARRRGFMIDPESAEADPPWEQFRELPYRTVVVRQLHPELLANWQRQQLVGHANGFNVYRVSEPVPISKLARSAQNQSAKTQSPSLADDQ